MGRRSFLFLPSKRRQPRRPTLSHLKGSELFETLPCESESILHAAQVGRIDCVRGVEIERVFPQMAWISRLRIHTSESFQTAEGRSGIQGKPCVVGPGFQITLRVSGMTQDGSARAFSPPIPQPFLRKGEGESRAHPHARSTQTFDERRTYHALRAYAVMARSGSGRSCSALLLSSGSSANAKSACASAGESAPSLA
jgi:hypothetical protein